MDPLSKPQAFEPAGLGGAGGGGGGGGDGPGGGGEGTGVPPPLTPPQPPHVFGQFPFTVDQWQYDLDLLHDQYGARPVLLMPAPDTLSSQAGCFPPVTQTRGTYAPSSIPAKLTPRLNLQ